MPCSSEASLGKLSCLKSSCHQKSFHVNVFWLQMGFSTSSSLFYSPQILLAMDGLCKEGVQKLKLLSFRVSASALVDVLEKRKQRRAES